MKNRIIKLKDRKGRIIRFKVKQVTKKPIKVEFDYKKKKKINLKKKIEAMLMIVLIITIGLPFLLIVYITHFFGELLWRINKSSFRSFQHIMDYLPDARQLN